MKNEQDLLKMIEADLWMMNVLRIARDLDLPDWMIGAGFVRNKVWDHLHGYKNKKVQTNDIDLIYFDKNNADEKYDKELSKRISDESEIKWEIINQAYTHKWHNTEPYKSTEEALAEWVETPTCVAVRLNDDGTLKLFAPLGINDLLNLIVRRNMTCSDSETYEKRIKDKGWKEKWPKLTVLRG